MKRKYPKEIYYDGRELFFGPGRDDLADLVENAYDIGLLDGRAESESTDGFFSLSRAYGEGARIDWEKLDGRMARIVSSGFTGAIERRLQRNTFRSVDHIYGWMPNDAQSPAYIFNDALMLRRGMELFVEGEIPLKAPTADELLAGTLFSGSRAGDLPRECVRYDFESRGVTTKRVASLFSDQDDLAEKFTVYGVRKDGVIKA